MGAWASAFSLAGVRVQARRAAAYVGVHNKATRCRQGSRLCRMVPQHSHVPWELVLSPDLLKAGPRQRSQRPPNSPVSS